jgi:hypothetical protein
MRFGTRSHAVYRALLLTCHLIPGLGCPVRCLRTELLEGLTESHQLYGRFGHALRHSSLRSLLRCFYWSRLRDWSHVLRRFSRWRCGYRRLL